jgi:hypothetical protein
MNRLLTMALALAGPATITNGAWAQAVQLPSFHYFTVSTTVSVPDRGAAYLGGVRRAASGRAGRGVPLLGRAPGLGRLGRSDAIGSSIGASDVSVSATIIDHRELDEAVLAEAGKRRGGDAIASAPEAEREAGALDHAGVLRAAPVASVADLRRQNAEQDEAQRQEALALVAKARQAEAAGKPGVAQVYYAMAARRGDDELRRRITERVSALREQLRIAAGR